jgi:CBS domain-containing protein
MFVIVMKKIGVKVGDVMTRDFISISPDISVLDCAKKMVKNHVGSLVIQNRGELKGIITEKDIIWALTKKEKKDLSKIKCLDITSRKIATIRPDLDLIDALQRMKKTKFRRLPVVVKNKVIGLLTLKDILRIEPDLFDIAYATNAMQIREEDEKRERKDSPKSFRVGICEECGNEDMLYKVDGALICESCSDKM